MSARTRSKRKATAVPEEEVTAPSKPAKRARRSKQEPKKQNPPEPVAPPPDLPDLPDLPPPPIVPPSEILPAADVTMEYPARDNGPATMDKPSLNQEPPHLVANEGPEDDPVDVIARERGAPERVADLYLDTVNRSALDFDFEKVCSISLSNLNVYGCLVCGKYFQGRSKKSPAYAHSISDDHHVFINLESTQVYVLPDGYPVSDPSLEDISRVLAPKFTPASVRALSEPQQSFDLNSSLYTPGYVGLNNIKANDYLNVVLQLLLHVPPLRDHLLLSSYSPSGKESELLKRFAALAKKLWNQRLFKSQVSPHEFLQEVVRVSAGRFHITKQGDPTEFLGWLLHTLHKDLGGTKKRPASVIYSTFQGDLKLDAQHVITKDALSGNIETVRPTFDIDRDIKSTRSPFLFLALDLPPPPLFQDAVEGKNIIPQVNIYSVLAKYDGVTSQEVAGQLKRFKCQRLPPYLILHYKRFMKNSFVEEKNPTIVNFPLKGLEMKDFVELSGGPSPVPTTYDLLANVTHESVASITRDKTDTAWKVVLRAPPLPSSSNAEQAGMEGEERWIGIQDLIVEDIRKEMIFLGETVLQVWERKDYAEAQSGVKRATTGGQGMDVDS